MSTAITRIPERIDAALSAPWQMRAMAIVDAIVLNVVILAVARLATGEYPVATVGGDDQAVGFVAVIGTTALAGLAAWGLLALLERVTSRAATVWTAIAIVVFLFSLLGPLGSGADTASKVALALLHTGAAATLIPLMRRSIGQD
jgi:Family of unknown function (DUF6069)